ncbi:2-deoxyribonucleoside glycosidase [Geoanaerobacter pelophilus]|uniref:2-deoxyribonucleoside glycosidase n=1 Tax=Geoanaerobacter pelophilus TaxID=60036 RepID=A0ABQ0MJI7_9BACT|nr:nucleoside 2-deoxyribosyltransferase [Geoanaerobacter pelophilus]GAW67224.1 2-deoxyribonucleoside glycosidase [Geoanaerobacter pelophilus]
MTEFSPSESPGNGLKVYLASPLGFSPENDHYREKVKKRLNQLHCTVFDPWEQEEVGRRIQEALGIADGVERVCAIKEAASFTGRVNADGIRAADLVLAVLDGTEPDSGTVAEVGFAAGIGKKCFGLRTDFRDCGDLPGLPLNLQLLHFIEYSGGGLFRSIAAIKF